MGCDECGKGQVHFHTMCRRRVPLYVSARAGCIHHVIFTLVPHLVTLPYIRGQRCADGNGSAAFTPIWLPTCARLVHLHWMRNGHLHCSYNMWGRNASDYPHLQGFAVRTSSWAYDKHTDIMQNNC